MTLTHTIEALDEPALERLAELVAFTVRAGDLIALTGDLGAGKSTFARAFIRAVSAEPGLDVPSPTFTLVQTYETQRLSVAHFDLYRLTDAAEIEELGLAEALVKGAALVEWPERAGPRLVGCRLDIELTETPGNPHTRDVTLTADLDWVPRFARLIDIRAFLISAGHAHDRISYLQGDASPRRYARLLSSEGTQKILMDWPQQPDGPPIRDGRPYSKIAHLAEGVRPFVAIQTILHDAGFSAPTIAARDLDTGLLVIEDFGDGVFGALVRNGGDQAELWRAGVATLAALRGVTAPAAMPLSDGSIVRLPRYDREALGIETELLLDWYWPALHGTPAPAAVRAEYAALWEVIFARLETLPHGLTLRDYHSPNLLWLPDRVAPRNVGLIDFQDAQLGPHAYDLVSLLQDARVDVDAALEADLLDHYCELAAASQPTFDAHSFRWSYAALGAQRNSKILGIFARLAHRDGKPAYLAHIPRIWRYVDRCLVHPELAELSAWYARAFPPSVRSKPIAQTAPARAAAPA
jgi:tRNA threonylcarbamoyl adenosine modification protein YjeE